MKEDKEKKEQICWYVQHDGDVLGPLSSSAVRRALLLDQVSLSDAVSKDGRIWRPLISVPEVVPPQLRRAGGEYGENRGESAARAEWLRLGAEKTPFLTLVLSITLVAVIIGYGLYKGGTPEPPVPDCSALPMPGVNWRNCSLNGIKAPSADLSRADIYSASLRGAMLSGGIFTDGILEFADLSDADLSYALLNVEQMKPAKCRLNQCRPDRC